MQQIAIDFAVPDACFNPADVMTHVLLKLNFVRIQLHSVYATDFAVRQQVRANIGQQLLYLTDAGGREKVLQFKLSNLISKGCSSNFMKREIGIRTRS
jgi:hypothetical protein